jgi:hypothetical protein
MARVWKLLQCSQNAGAQEVRDGRGSKNRGREEVKLLDKLAGLGGEEGIRMHI